MSKTNKFSPAELLWISDGTNKRAFFPSRNIDIFPCSRRGQSEDPELPYKVLQYDPEARLNTERTNRLHTSINGFKVNFIESFIKYKDENGTELETGTLTFVLAGYRIEVRGFNPASIATNREINSDTIDTIYAHLSLHDDISLGVENYHTEILYRQSISKDDKNYLDVSYTVPNSGIVDDFFTGVSFTATPVVDTILVDTGYKELAHADLALFTINNSTWELVQTSLLPKVEHDTEPDSIKLSGDFTVEHTDANGEKQTSFKVTKDKTTLGPTEISELDVTGDFTVKQVSDEGEEISFEITKLGVGTVNVPLHITKATAIDGLLNSTSATRTKNLIVGELIEGERFPDEGTIKAKTRIETPTLEATDSTKTPALDVKIIENKVDDSGVGINDNLNITTRHAVAVDTLKVDTINSRQENAVITVGSPVTVEGKATLNNGLELTAGDALIKSNLIVEDNINVGTPDTPATANNGGYIVAKKDITAEHDLIAKNDISVENNLVVTNNTKTTTLEATESTKTQVIDVKTLKNDQDNTGVITVKDSLNVDTGYTVKVDTVNVDTISSRQANGTITIESPITLDSDAILDKNLTVGTEGDLDTGKITAKNLIKTPTLNVNSIISNSDKVRLDTPIDVTGKATLINGLEVTSGDAIIRSNLKVDDNINVGTPTTPANTNNGGYVVAKKDITAEQDLIAKRDIKVTKKATVESLVVGERTNTDSAKAGVITAKNLIKTPTLETTTIDVDNITSDAAEGLVINPKTTLNNGLDVTVGDTSLRNLFAEETKLDSLAIAGEAADGSILTVNGTTTITDDLAVFGTTSATTLKVDTITSNSEEVVVNKNLKVGTITAGTEDLTVSSDLVTLDVSAEKIDAKEFQLKSIGQVPALELAHLTKTDTYQVRFKFGAPINIIEV